MGSVLFLGLVMGLRHAFEADHLAAVASLSTRDGPRASMQRGAAWGLGHSAILLIIGAAYWSVGASVPVDIAHWSEAGVGVMMLVLGMNVFRRIRRGPLLTFETHLHAPDAKTPARAFVVGVMHGTAGSSALMLLTQQAILTPWMGMLYVLVFGVGSIAGMVLASGAIAIPLNRSTVMVNRALPVYETAVGVVTVTLGLWLIYGAIE